MSLSCFSLFKFSRHWLICACTFSWLHRYWLTEKKSQMSHLMTKLTKWLCAQWRLRSAWASAQSDQSLRCLHEESLDPWLSIECTEKTLIRLGWYPGWSESSLGAKSFCWFCHEEAQISNVVFALHLFQLLKAEYQSWKDSEDAACDEAEVDR